jgi:hypothetical protein
MRTIENIRMKCSGKMKKCFRYNISAVRVSTPIICINLYIFYTRVWGLKNILEVQQPLKGAQSTHACDGWLYTNTTYDVPSFSADNPAFVD